MEPSVSPGVCIPPFDADAYDAQLARVIDKENHMLAELVHRVDQYIIDSVCTIESIRQLNRKYPSRNPVTHCMPSQETHAEYDLYLKFVKDHGNRYEVRGIQVCLETVEPALYEPRTCRLEFIPR